MPDITWDGRDLVMDVTLHPSDALDPSGHHGHSHSHHVVTQRINISQHVREIVREELSKGRSPEMAAKAREWGDSALARMNANAPRKDISTVFYGGALGGEMGSSLTLPRKDIDA